jgi:8-oxo-dGTP diphosphatase
MRQEHNQKLRFAVLAADVVLLTLRDDTLLARIIKVDRPPFFINDKGLPGGLLKATETAEQAMARIIKEKTNIKFSKVYIEQLATFSKVKRDPRGRVVAVGYLALVPWENLSTSEQVSNSETWWQPVNQVGRLAYDHNEMLNVGLSRLRSKITYSTLIQKLLPKMFTLGQLETTYTTVLGHELDKRNFRRKLKQINVLKSTGHRQSGTKHRPALLYTFRSNEVSITEVI